MRKILTIGTTSDVKNNKFTGQSVMFDGVVNHLLKKNMKVSVIDISSRIRKKGTLFRSIDYFVILIELIFKICTNKYDLAYIVSSQSKKGFMRDRAMISLCRSFKIPVITHQYGANYHQLLNALDDRGLKKLKSMLGYVTTIIVEGDYMKEQFSFLDGYKIKVKAIPNGLPIEGKHSKIVKSYDGSSPFVMFYLSNLIWSKGYYDVLQAVDILVNEYHMNVKCIFAGRFLSSADDVKPGISNKEDFDRFISEHQLSDYVDYYQGLYGDQKDEKFYQANVFLLPTYYINEGQPVSIIEALAYGCVPIVTEYRHIPMMVNKKNGCFVNPKRPDDIAKQVKRLIEHPNEYAEKSRNCIADYQQKFKFDVYVNSVMECINSIIG